MPLFYELSCAENVTGLKPRTEAAGFRCQEPGVRCQEGFGHAGEDERVEDLEVFRRAYRLSLEIHRSSLALPRIEQFALADQLRRSSKSICANLAEGFAK